jgi:putative flippase GtrA
MQVSLDVLAYGTVSVAALIVELAVLQAALAAHLYQPVAISCGYTVSAIFQFSALRFVVFKAAHRALSIQALSFVAGQIVLWAVLVAAVALLTAIFPLTTMQARLICIPSLFPVNYLVSKYIIFRK